MDERNKNSDRLHELRIRIGKDRSSFSFRVRRNVVMRSSGRDVSNGDGSLESFASNVLSGRVAVFQEKYRTLGSSSFPDDGHHRILRKTARNSPKTRCGTLAVGVAESCLRAFDQSRRTAMRVCDVVNRVGRFRGTRSPVE
jgi:hypothetical protein